MTAARWRSMVVLWAVLWTVLAASAALAAEPGGLEVDRVETGGYPEVRLEVTVPGDVAPEDPAVAFTVTEDGERRSVSVTRLPSEDVETVLLIDTSGSMQGEPIAAARRAAGAFLERLPSGVKVAVVGFGSDASVLAPFSTDREAARHAIAGLDATGETALYDGVTAALGQFTEDTGTAVRSIVLLSDGGDTASQTSLDDTASLLAASGVRLHAIELRTSETDPASLARLAEASDGRVVPVDDADGLDAVYTTLASELVNRFQLTYRSEGHGATDIRVELGSDGATMTGEQRVALPAPAAPAPVEPATPTTVLPEGEVVAVPALWTSPVAVGAAGTAVFLGLLVLAYVVLAVREPRRRLAVENGVLRTSRSTGLAELAGQATNLAERHLERHGWRGSLNAALERAGLDLRPGEYVVLAACAATAAFAVGFLLASLPVAMLFAAVALLGARFVLSFLTSRRQAAFAEQLGDVLQLLAGSLRAGYGLLQAIDAVSREADSPACDEFGRVMVESRLGRDTIQSLRAMANRTDSEDFGWVVQAIEIHREVGGDLAEVLDTVAGTIRERNQIRRQIKTLSAEGRLSAYILLGLPIAMAAFISITNPSYMAELTTSPAGLVMIALGLVLMAVGALWMRKLIRLVF